MALRIWPTWPARPVSWAITGLRLAGNHEATSRSTQMNVMASPAPTSTRATTAPPTLVEKASSTWPAAITTPPVTISSRGPNRSTSTPTGICRPA